jgi:hypothetical protein
VLKVHPRAVLWIPGCLSRIPQPYFFHPGSEFFPSRIRIKEFKNFNTKKWFLSTQKYDSDCSSRIRISDPDFLSIPDPGPRGQKGTASRIRFRNTASLLTLFVGSSSTSLVIHLSHSAKGHFHFLSLPVYQSIFLKFYPFFQPLYDLHRSLISTRLTRSKGTQAPPPL